MTALMATVNRDTLSWVVDIFTLVGVPIALVGVGIAIRESIKSGELATAARNAVIEAERHLSGNHLIGLSAAFETLETDLYKSIRDDDRDRCNEILIRWRQQANELIGLLDQRKNVDPELVTSFQKLVTVVGQAQVELVDSPTVSVAIVTKDIRIALPDALGHLSRYAGALKMTAKEDGDGT